ncbi:nucleotide sugar dehydrogenase [Roseobacter denitrificans]|uniref:UDP-glucose/GDP-mannose dehydrogenase, putative n=1 Tax=Roseobacter denitrificans (strain ATCC 33942 / OCh 114) TaxID=375451 RepID=Q16A67_ROSDO|nr:nucleotide sugar dehydrogenase [Roseobacter denitrificans]ABG31126.1 UDP-glucose/GDP-mannose dehydrogenase, putative [Roseobacter denitrificans OCh 114]AVL54195.1 nucleotide sugar dehydrogenase [Roseobacter denitrificans]SFG32546.1 UDP-N-acetyl-D-glucosamine dehydrogenase [Roseobacter denitrificans OCh 114]
MSERVNSTPLETILSRITQKKAVIGIIGMGYVGIPLAVAVGRAGYPVIGFDVLDARIEQLNTCQSPIGQIPNSALEEISKTGFVATGDFARVCECDALMICVPTPLDKMREPDLSFIISTMETIAPHLRAGQILALESTTWPGTTYEVLKPYIARTGLTVGTDFFLVYSPEREDPGNADFNTQSIPKVLGGDTQACRDVGVALYSAFIDQVVPVSSTKAAEMTKLLENIQRAVNIGLMNEMKVVADAMDLDIHEVIDAAATKPFGFVPYYPGPGIGGHCIPIDPFYLTWKAREFGLHTRFIELAGEINASMPSYVVNKLIRALSERGKALKGAKVMVLGIAYKRDIEDVRESPSVLIMELLRDWHVDLSYSDPHVPVFPVMREHQFDLSSTPLTPETLAEQDAVLLLTDHTGFDYDMIAEHAPLLIDTRGVYRRRGQNVPTA